MSWAEIRPKIDGLGDRLERDGWPVPSDPDFWKWAYKDEALPIIVDQLPKYTNENPTALRVLAKSYLMVFDMGALGDEHKAAQIINEGIVYKPTTIDIIIDGPLLSALLDNLGYSKIRQAKYLPDFKKQNSGFQRKIKNADPATKALMWWGMWGDLDFQYNRSRSEYSTPGEPVLSTAEGVSFMVEKLGLTPPEII